MWFEPVWRSDTWQRSSHVVGGGFRRPEREGLLRKGKAEKEKRKFLS